MARKAVDKAAEQLKPGGQLEPEEQQEPEGQQELKAPPEPEGRQEPEEQREPEGQQEVKVSPELAEQPKPAGQQEPEGQPKPDTHRKYKITAPRKINKAIGGVSFTDGAGTCEDSFTASWFRNKGYGVKEVQHGCRHSGSA